MGEECGGEGVGDDPLARRELGQLERGVRVRRARLEPQEAGRVASPDIGGAGRGQSRRVNVGGGYVDDDIIVFGAEEHGAGD